jgi:hypothetical protein
VSLGFTYGATKAGEVHIARDGRHVTTLRATAAVRFLTRAGVLDERGQQQLMARATGNYKRGNES